MSKFYNEIADRMGEPLNDLMIDAIQAACITEAEWQADSDDCIGRVNGALEELYDFDFQDGVDEAQEWYDFDPDC
jgi:hypothetical protein